MIGPEQQKCTLRSEAADGPQGVDLHPYEEVDRAAPRVAQPAPPHREALYRVLTTCHHCQGPIRLVLMCTPAGRQQVHMLLVTSVSIVCPTCARTRGYV